MSVLDEIRKMNVNKKPPKRRFLKEVTEWSEKHNVKNHTYILEGTLCVGYVPDNDKEKAQLFRHPLKHFSRTGRKFVDVTREYKTLQL